MRKLGEMFARCEGGRTDQNMEEIAKASKSSLTTLVLSRSKKLASAKTYRVEHRRARATQNLQLSSPTIVADSRSKTLATYPVVLREKEENSDRQP